MKYSPQAYILEYMVLKQWQDLGKFLSEVNIHILNWYLELFHSLIKVSLKTQCYSSKLLSSQLYEYAFWFIILYCQVHFDDTVWSIILVYLYFCIFLLSPCVSFYPLKPQDAQEYVRLWLLGYLSIGVFYELLSPAIVLALCLTDWSLHDSCQTEFLDPCYRAQRCSCSEPLQGWRK